MEEITESPTIEEAVEQASNSLTSSSTENAQPVETEDSQTENTETQEQPTKEVQEETPVDSLIDPETLPKELKPIYEQMKRNMDKGFTQGRQKDREQINQLQKELAQLKQQAQPDPQKVWETLTPEQKIEQLANQKVLEAKLNDFRDQALKDYNTLDKRLDNSEGNEAYDKTMDTAISTQLDKLLEDHVAIHGNELGFDYQTHAKELIQEWDNYIKTNTDRFLAKQRELAKKNESKTMKSNPKSSNANVQPNSTMSLEDAVSAAFNKVG